MLIGEHRVSSIMFYRRKKMNNVTNNCHIISESDEPNVNNNMELILKSY